MRIWLNPAQLNKYALTSIDVSNAVQAQNVEISAGQIGGANVHPALDRTLEDRGAAQLALPLDAARKADVDRQQGGRHLAQVPERQGAAGLRPGAFTCLEARRALAGAPL